MVKPVTNVTSTLRVLQLVRRRYFNFVARPTIMLIISNIRATKGVEFGPLPSLIGSTCVTDGGFFLFAARLRDSTISEVYTFRACPTEPLSACSPRLLCCPPFLLSRGLQFASFYKGQEMAQGLSRCHSFLRVPCSVPLRSDPERLGHGGDEEASGEVCCGCA